jgi:hypothetical protein
MPSSFVQDSCVLFCQLSIKHKLHQQGVSTGWGLWMSCAIWGPAFTLQVGETENNADTWATPNSLNQDTPPCIPWMS